MLNQKELTLFCEQTCKGAGEVILSLAHKRRVLKSKDSESLDIATSADYASEKYIIDKIKHTYPGHSILTEETPDLLQKSDYEWIIDPLDGTKEFIRHSPYYYVLLALEYKGSLICGSGYQPELKRLFSAAYRQVPTINGEEVHLSDEMNLSKSFIYLALPSSKLPNRELDRYMDFIKSLTYQAYRLRNTPWDVESLYNVASGAAEGFVMPSSQKNPGPQWWDIAPGILMVESSGGKVTDFCGNPIQNRDISKGLVASNGKVHEALLNLCHYLII